MNERYLKMVEFDMKLIKVDTAKSINKNNSKAINIANLPIFKYNLNCKTSKPIIPNYLPVLSKLLGQVGHFPLYLRKKLSSIKYVKIGG